MRLILVVSYLVSLSTTALGQTPATTEQKLTLSDGVRIAAFESHKRPDGYGIASFAISNDTDKPVNSIELMCWPDDDRAHGTTVLIWPKQGAIPAHGSQEFSNVNIGRATRDARSTCEVARVE